MESRRVDATSGDEERTEMGVIVKDELKDPYNECGGKTGSMDKAVWVIRIYTHWAR